MHTTQYNAPNTANSSNLIVKFVLQNATEPFTPSCRSSLLFSNKPFHSQFQTVQLNSQPQEAFQHRTSQTPIHPTCSLSFVYSLTSRVLNMQPNPPHSPWHHKPNDNRWWTEVMQSPITQFPTSPRSPPTPALQKWLNLTNRKSATNTTCRHPQHRHCCCIDRGVAVRGQEKLWRFFCDVSTFYGRHRFWTQPQRFTS